MFHSMYFFSKTFIILEKTCLTNQFMIILCRFGRNSWSFFPNEKLVFPILYVTPSDLVKSLTIHSSKGTVSVFYCKYFLSIPTQRRFMVEWWQKVWNSYVPSLNRILNASPFLALNNLWYFSHFLFLSTFIASNSFSCVCHI